jgi:hypothetical protein
MEDLLETLTALPVLGLSVLTAFAVTWALSAGAFLAGGP